MTTTENEAASEPTGLVAVIGLGCVLPDANNVHEFWTNLQRGHCSIREVPKERWDPALFWSEDHSAEDKTYAKIGAFVTNFAFDPRKFRIPPKVIKSLDDSQLWALEAARQCLNEAGLIENQQWDRSRCAIILGNAMGGETRNYTGNRVASALYQRAISKSTAFQRLASDQRQALLTEAEKEYKSHLPVITEDTMPGELSNVIAGRIANMFDLGGKNLTTDAACASSLAAIDVAVKTLVAGEADLVLTGGVDRSMDPATYVKFSKIGALSADGSFPFDARANGFVMGEGAALFLMKRYEDALRDGDKIHAVMRGVGSSSDGRGKGITAPNIKGQTSCIARALTDAMIPPGEVDLVECHGTSTKVGDVVEIQGLNETIGKTASKKQSIPIGSVKSNIGHLKAAAGAAAVLKAILALEHKTIPASLGFQKPNPNVDWADTAFYVNDKTKPFPEPPGQRPRRIGVSSFGFGGTNFHVIVEEFAPGKTTPKVSPKTRATGQPAARTPGLVTDAITNPTRRHGSGEPLHADAHTDVLVVGAADEEALVQRIGATQNEISSVSPKRFHSWLRERNARAVKEATRVACVVSSPQDAAEQLDRAAQAVQDPKKRLLLANKGIHFGQGPAVGKIAFLFPGQGSQYADMMRELATRFESAKRTLEEADRIMKPLIGGPLTPLLFTDPSKGRDRDSVEADLKRTEITQPAVLAADLTILRLLREYGVRPDAVAGHSLGEYGALVAAGVLTFEDAVQAVSARGREMANVSVPDMGKMASIGLDPERVEKALKNVDGYVIPANKNCKVQTVIAGASDAVERAVTMFQENRVQAQFIPVSAAFHSQIVAPAQKPLRQVLERLDVREPRVPILSNVHADYYPVGPNAREGALDLLEKQVAAPVEWQAQVERLYRDGVRTFVEVGPKAVLTTFVRNILDRPDVAAAATNHPKKGAFFHIFDALALLAARGHAIDFPDPASPDISMPGFLRELEATNEGQGQGRSTPEPSVVPKLGAPLDAQRFADDFIKQKQRELEAALRAQFATQTTPVNATAPTDPELSQLKRRVEALGINLEPILITGVSAGTPGSGKHLFDESNFERIFNGENAIEPLTRAEQERFLDKNIVRLVKSSTGDHRFERIQDVAEVIKLAGKKGDFDLVRDYGINADLDKALDISSRMAIAAGIEALRDAGIPLVRGYIKTTTGKYLPGEWALPEPLQAETGIIFASAFPGYSSLVEYLSKYLAKKYAAQPAQAIHALYDELIQKIQNDDARASLQGWYDSNSAMLAQATESAQFEFNRRFLFQVLAMGHSQFAQLIRAKGPNTQINAACASTTQGIALAEDWIRMGRCKRVIVVGADDITNENMLEHWASGFLASGAATTEADVTKAALPFDRRRHGMIIGSGAVGVVVEAESLVKGRGMEGITELLATCVSNSAYHGTRLDTEHIATLMDALLANVEQRTGTPRAEIAPRLMFMSHETYTPARGGSALAEIEALTKTFGNEVSKVVVANTKGFTGHPMGAGIEDAIAVRSVQFGRVPPIANFKEPDPTLGDIKLSKGGGYDVQYGLRLAAGFGSQIAMYVMKLRSRDVKRVVDQAGYDGWLRRVSGYKSPELEVESRTLRIKAQLPVLQEAPVQPKSTPAPKLEPTPAVAPIAAAVAPGKVSQTEVVDEITNVIADQTGYPKDMLEPDLDLEADLGIDTVKQAELFGLVREKYAIPRDDTVQLKDYNTLSKIAGYVVKNAAAATTAGSASESTTTQAAEPEARAASVPTKGNADRSPIQRRFIEILVEKTGYTQDLLEPDLDLEADLGIDTVKQAELFGTVREEFSVERDDSIQLKDYNTINKVVDYLAAKAGTSTEVTAQASRNVVQAPRPAPEPEANLGTTTVAPGPPTTVSRAPAAQVTPDEALAEIRNLVADQTGYTADLLEPDLDLEADLGIDTVKQAELFGLVREKYAILRDDSIQLSEYNTLSKIADFVATNAGSAVSPQSPTGTTPAPTATAVKAEQTASPSAPNPEPSTVSAKPIAAPATSPKPEADPETILHHVQGVVAEQTGYTTDLLDPELDLEADLGIDTVKQAELFGIIRQHYNIERDDTIQLSDYNTLHKIVKFIQAKAAGATHATTTQVYTDANLGTAEATSESVPKLDTATVEQATGLKETTRYLVRYVEAPATEINESALNDKVIVVCVPKNLRQPMDAALAHAGAHAVLLDALPRNLDEAQAWMDEERRSNKRINGLIFVPTPNAAGSEFDPDDAHVPKAYFHLVKAILTGAKSGEVTHVGAVTFMGGDFATAPADPIHPLDGAIAGLTKAIARELQRATVKVVDFDLHADAESTSSILVDELRRNDGTVEIGTHHTRGTLKLLAQETVEEEPGIELTTNDVVIVTGGGTGITSETVQRLAHDAPACFILVGRTQLDPDAPRYANFNDRDWNAKRVELQSQLKSKGERVTPVVLERGLAPLRKSAEIHQTLQRINATGARATYMAADANDAKALRRIVERVTREFGPVTGLIHGAGLEESKLIVDKTPQAFDRIFNTKVLAARALLESTADQPLRFFLAYGSVAGRFGNAGQADYSAANDALAKLCASLRQERGEGFAATTMDWSAWDEKGMATRGSIMKVLGEAGVTPIPLAEGVERVAQELAHGCQDHEVLVAAELGRLAPDEAMTTRDAVERTPSRTPSRNQPTGTTNVDSEPRQPPQEVSSDDGQQVLVVEDDAQATDKNGNLITTPIDREEHSARATLHLDPDNDPYLKHHAVDGTPYLPGVFGVEAFAETAQVLAPPGYHFVGHRDVQFRLPAKCLRGRPLDVTIHASVANDLEGQFEVGCRLQSVFVNPKGETMGAPRIHFTGTLRFARDRPKPPATAPEMNTQLDAIVEQKDIYAQFFHGPSFRVLDRVAFGADGKSSYGLWADPRAKLFRDRKPNFLTHPMLRELAYQTAGAYELFKNRYLSLPKGVAELIYYQEPKRPDFGARAYATFKGLSDNVARFDVTVATTQGEVLFEMRDLELVRLRPLEIRPVAPAPEPETADNGSGPSESVFRNRWGHDVPLPSTDIVAVRVDANEIEQLGIDDQSSLTAGEREDQSRFRNEKRAKEFFLGRLAAKEAIAELLGRPVGEARGIEIRRLESGEPKPHGKGMDDVIVSISHTGDHAIAVAGLRTPDQQTVGIDVERIEPKTEAFESEALAQPEQQLLDRLEAEGTSRDELRIRFWAVKEAVLKAVGKGFALDVQDVQIESIHDDQVTVYLRPAALEALVAVGGNSLKVQSWVTDGLAYAFVQTSA